MFLNDIKLTDVEALKNRGILVYKKLHQEKIVVLSRKVVFPFFFISLKFFN